MKQKDILRFYSKIIRKDDCWEWSGAIDRGYARMKVGGESILASHIAFYIKMGRWPQSYVKHTCKNRGCVNPNHMEESV